MQREVELLQVQKLAHVGEHLCGKSCLASS